MPRLPALARRRRADLRERGTIPQATMHMVFKGPAGTGKTSVARIAARLFHALGLLPTDKVVEIPLGEVMHAGETGARTRLTLVPLCEDGCRVVVEHGEAPA